MQLEVATVVAWVTIPSATGGNDNDPETDAPPAATELHDGAGGRDTEGTEWTFRR